MSLVKTWYSLEDAADKFGLDTAKLQQWIEDGLVRCEREGKKILRVNIDDVKLEVEAMIKNAAQ